MMNEPTQLENLAEAIYTLESTGADLTKNWRKGIADDNSTFAKLKKMSAESIHALEQLSTKLHERLQNSVEHSRDNVEYAYQLVQELIQSRRATQELLTNMLQHPNEQYAEYIRALSIKEKAAEQQAQTLISTVQKLQ